MSVIVEVKDISIDKVQTFFSFCGEIKSINELSSGKFQINFANVSAVDTALLLDQAELDGEKVKVSNALPSYESTTSSATPIATGGDVKHDNKVQDDDLKTGDANYDDIEQEHKPKYVIMAQLLSRGYKINDDIIAKSIAFDKKHGLSENFKKFLKDLDVRLGSLTVDDKKAVELATNEKDGLPAESPKFSEAAVKSFNENVENFKKSKYYGKFSKYFDRLDKASKDFAKKPYGVKIHDFYRGLVGDVKAVHEEAKRLSELKKEEEINSKVEDVKTTIDSK